MSSRWKKAIREAFRKNRWCYFTTALIFTVNTVIFLLYNIMMEPLLYSGIIILLILIMLTVFSSVSEKKKMDKRQDMISAFINDRRELPDAESISEQDYSRALAKLAEQLDKIVSETDEERQDMTDYYTAWVHQIKTPIAVMKLKLAEDTELNRALSAELFRIEQYVDMVLQYIRLGSQSNDLVIKECCLDELIKESIHKYAPQFIHNRLRLTYNGTDKVFVTDRKWFCCILDQLLSNAVKYTKSGGVTIGVEEDRLIIEDTGIGIASEDLPRIFEKGFTGNNGRLGNKSSGLGLYLVQKAAKLLCIPVSVESTPGKGSRFILKLEEREITAS
ncbi:MAG: hypothetical protein CW338_02840 [Clostridiales bacterium]|nr:hypothetical protein [Clostridiales bacterium]